jgi:cytochrome c-type biogenesis protein CcmH
MHTLRCKYLSPLMSMLLISSVNTLATAVEWQDVAANLMSPACPGRTLLNCTSGHAEQWRELIRQKIAQGETKEQITAYFVEMRGEEILAAPPKRGFALTAWLFPVLLIINGVGVIFVLTRRWTIQRSAPENGWNLSMSTTTPSREYPSLGPYRDRLQKELKDFSA